MMNSDAAAMLRQLKNLCADDILREWRREGQLGMMSKVSRLKKSRSSAGSVTRQNPFAGSE